MLDMEETQAKKTSQSENMFVETDLSLYISR